MNTLYINLILYLTYTFWGFKKCRALTVHNILSIWFTFIALMGCICVNCGYYQIIYGRVTTLPLYPYILCFLSFIFLMYPLQKINYKKVHLINIPLTSNTKFRTYSFIPLLILILFTIAYIPSVITALTTKDISDVYDSQRIDGIDIYNYSPLANAIIWIGRKFFNWFYGIFLFYSIWNLRFQNKKEQIYLISILLVATIPYFLRTISTGGRGGFIFFTMQIIVLILPLHNYINKKLKQKFYIVCLIFIAISIPYVAAMTEGRTEGGSESAFGAIIRYFGEPYPNLGKNIWEKTNHFLMGRRMYPELFGFTNNSQMSQYEKFRLWEFLSGIRMLNYKTIFGDFYVEFGATIAIIIIGSMGILMNRYLKRRCLSFYQLPLYSLYIDVCITAPLWFNRRNTGDLLIIIQCLIVSFLLKKIIKKKQ
ncbi:O-antigen polymerase [Phocaeicola sp.]